MTKLTFTTTISKAQNEYVMLKQREWNMPMISSIIARIIEEHSNGIAPAEVKRKIKCFDHPRCPCCQQKIILTKERDWVHLGPNNLDWIDVLKKKKNGKVTRSKK